MSTPTTGNAFPPGNPPYPIYYPPIELRWVFTILVVFAGSVTNRLSPSVRNIFGHPVGFFVTAAVAIAIFQAGFAPGAFAILFFLLSVWSTHLSTEGFLNASSIEFVTNSKRWFVEEVLKERPVAIQDKNVETYPVQGDP
jgi:hypothetical protein